MPQRNISNPSLASDPTLQQNFPLGMSNSGAEMFTATAADDTAGRPPMLHVRQASGMSDMGQADQFPAPTINIEPAPVSRQASFDNGMNQLGDTLSPPSSTLCSPPFFFSLIWSPRY